MLESSAKIIVIGFLVMVVALIAVLFVVNTPQRETVAANHNSGRVNIGYCDEAMDEIYSFCPLTLLDEEGCPLTQEAAVASCQKEMFPLDDHGRFSCSCNWGHPTFDALAQREPGTPSSFTANEADPLEGDRAS
ncbi:hypothetical protein HY933_03775 [Candidatus Falkowbacteria bacterium]|nr:hypothetical protein [Candidatus Falkowbacteria bacterium]